MGKIPAASLCYVVDRCFYLPDLCDEDRIRSILIQQLTKQPIHINIPPWRAGLNLPLCPVRFFVQTDIREIGKYIPRYINEIFHIFRKVPVLMIGQDKPVPYRLSVQHEGEGIGVRELFPQEAGASSAYRKKRRNHRDKGKLKAP